MRDKGKVTTFLGIQFWITYKLIQTYYDNDLMIKVNIFIELFSIMTLCFG